MQFGLHGERQDCTGLPGQSTAALCQNRREVTRGEIKTMTTAKMVGAIETRLDATDRQQVEAAAQAGRA